MLILLMLALAASDGGMKAPPPALQVQSSSPARGEASWFQPGTRSFGSSALIEHAERPLDSAPVEAASPEMNCTMRIFKADPKFDAKIARPGPPDLDPKIVRPSPCKK